MAEAEIYKSGFIALIGETNAGKSTLLNALLAEKVSIVTPKPQTTRVTIRGIKTTANAQYVFLDTPGFMRKSQSALDKQLIKATKDGIAGADFCILVLDAAKLQVRPDLLRETAELIKKHHFKTPELVLLNKIDLLKDKKMLLPLFEQVMLIFATENPSLQVVPISAKDQEGISDLEQVLFDLLPTGPALFPQEMTSEQSEEFFITEIIREKLMLNLRDELPYQTAVVLEKMEEGAALLRINAAIVVARDSQKGIVVGRGGSMIKTIGSSSRMELEKRFGTKVYLELFVKVEPNWHTHPPL